MHGDNFLADHPLSLTDSQPRQFNATHLEELQRSGISEITATQHGMRTLKDCVEIARLLAWSRNNNVTELGPCLFLPYFDIQGKPSGYYRLKPERPFTGISGKPSKYLGPKGMSVRVYFPLFFTEAYQSVESPLIITEGEKKALCASSYGFTTIGLGGVTCWSKKRELDGEGKPIGPRQLNSDLASIPLANRIINIAFDSDRATNPDVLREEMALAKALQAAGAIVKIIKLPAGQTPSGVAVKQGLDDFLVAHGATALQKLIDQAVSPASNSNNNGFQQISFSNSHAETYLDAAGKEKTKFVGEPVGKLVNTLQDATEGFPKRVGNLPFCREGHQILYLEKPDHLAAWIGRAFYQMQPQLDSNPVIWRNGYDKSSMGQFYAAIQQQAESFDAVALYPHEPILPCHYYCHPELGNADTQHLFELISRFAPATEIDGDLILSFFLTLACGVPHGQRPAFLMSAFDEDEKQGRGVGKTTLVRMASLLFGGLLEYDKDENMNAFKTRMLSPAARGMRVILFDNIKSHRFSMSSLEAIITASTISGKQNYVGEGQLPNTYTWCLTINGANLSKDMAQRCVIIKLTRPEYDGTWERETRLYIEDHRWKIISGLVAILKGPSTQIGKYTRWAEWEELVVSRVGHPQECMQTILERQGAIDDDEEEKELVRQGIFESLLEKEIDPVAGVAFIPSKELATILTEITGENRATNKASTYLGNLGIRELKKSDRGTARGWYWRGLQSTADTPVQRVR